MHPTTIHRDRIGLIAIAIVSLLGDHAVRAFCPDVGFSLLGFRVSPNTPTISHARQVELESTAIWKDYFKYTKPPTPVMLQAQREIMQATADVDSPVGNPNEKDVPEAHFDDELFEGGQNRLIMLRSQMIDEIKDGRTLAARRLLGRQLHALQDFYSHSNYVEIQLAKGATAISSTLGRPGAAFYQPSNAQTCRDCGYSFKGDAKAAYTRNNTCLRNCNKMEDLLKTTVCISKAQNQNPPSCIPSSCQDNLVAGTTLTTGYYLTDNPVSEKPVGKCSHGGLFDNGAFGVEGINKDTTINYFSPHSYLHSKAVDFSRRATKQYFEDLTKGWPTVTIEGQKYKNPALNLVQLQRLFGMTGNPLVLVIDITDSMVDYLPRIKKAATSLVDRLQGTENAPSRYVLMAYQEPLFLNSAFGTFSAEEFKNEINKLEIGSGGDCPEPAISAILRAFGQVGAARPNIFLFTDAAPSDANQLSYFYYSAEYYIPRVFVFLFPSRCSFDNQYTYKKITEKTQSQLFTLGENSDPSSLISYVAQRIATRNVDLGAKSYPAPPSRKVRGLENRAPKTQKVSVDDFVTSLTFSLSSLGNLSIIRPSGSTVGDSDPDVMKTETPGAVSITLSDPTPGQWKAIYKPPTEDPTAAGGQLQIFAKSSLVASDFNFVVLSGSNGHYGFFPLIEDYAPAPTTRSYVLANVQPAESIQNVYFEFRAAGTFQVLSRFNLTAGSVGSEFIPGTFYGTTTVPAGFFFAYVVGKDVHGNAFERQFPNVLGSSQTAPSS